mgnify:CR=1 FL=1
MEQKKRIAELEEENQQLKDTIEELNKTIDELNQTIDTLNKKIVELNNRILVLVQENGSFADKGERAGSCYRRAEGSYCRA